MGSERKRVTPDKRGWRDGVAGQPWVRRITMWIPRCMGTEIPWEFPQVFHRYGKGIEIEIPVE